MRWFMLDSLFSRHLNCHLPLYIYKSFAFSLSDIFSFICLCIYIHTFIKLLLSFWLIILQHFNEHISDEDVNKYYRYAIFIFFFNSDIVNLYNNIRTMTFIC